ncbi:MAG: hypothetical protein HN377_04015 [Alphaproteobacteria bacterium]|jgi:flagellar hook protein FlgE|nr:hypothetical protein [Alphaproteobacteria bacterium]MBT7943185.1 hypothetical protein [Alphaproteobacteria bacterium]
MALERVLTTAVSGLKANAKKAQVSATNIVNQNTAGYKAVQVQTVSRNAGTFAGSNGKGSGVVAELVAGSQAVDVALEFTRLIEAEAAYKANAAVIRTSEEIQRKAVNLIA